MPPGNPIVLVALGSNLGDSMAVIQSAFLRLQEFSSGPVRKSSLWSTSPVDCPPGSPPFVNAAASFPSLAGETPESLLVKLQSLEKEFGRRPKVVLNEARPLDLDLIAFGDESRNTPSLILPHPRATQRRFVLLPLSEIEPGFVLPSHSQSIEGILADLQTPEDVRRIAPPTT